MAICALSLPFDTADRTLSSSAGPRRAARDIQWLVPGPVDTLAASR